MNVIYRIINKLKRIIKKEQIKLPQYLDKENDVDNIEEKIQKYEEKNSFISSLKENVYQKKKAEVETPEIIGCGLGFINSINS